VVSDASANAKITTTRDAEEHEILQARHGWHLHGVAGKFHYGNSCREYDDKFRFYLVLKRQIYFLSLRACRYLTSR
jgi:hypothetical protein